MQYQSSCAPKPARKCGLNIGWPVVRTDGQRAGGVRSRDYQMFLGWVDFLTHGAPQARFARQSSAITYKIRLFGFCLVFLYFDILSLIKKKNIFTGLSVRPVIKWAFGRLRRKTASRGREDTTVWYRETMFSQMVSYEFLLHGALHGYFLYLVCAPPEKPTKRCEPEEGYLRCSKRSDHGSHSIIFLLFEFKSVR